MEENEDLKFLMGHSVSGDNDDHLVVDNDGQVQFTANKEGYKKPSNISMKMNNKRSY